MKTELNEKHIIEAINSVLEKQLKPIPLHEPSFQGNEWNYVKECLDTGWVSSVGKFVDEFEKKLAEFTGIPYAIACVNGTAALHLCLKLADVREGDEVLSPTLTFVATTNAISYCRCIPHFIDSDEESLGVSPHKLESHLEKNSEIRGEFLYNKTTGRRIKALVVMHTYGHPSDMDLLVEICKKYKLELIEDAAESLGSYYKGKHTGHWGKLTALSFNGNKIVTTGGGGAILTSDPELAKQAKHISTTAKIPHLWNFTHDQIGYNYRLPNINAALGCAQLELLPSFVNQKRALSAKYQRAFEKAPGVKFFTEPSYAKSNYWLNTILLDTSATFDQRNKLLQRLRDAGFQCRPTWDLMHRLTMYSDCPKSDLSQAESLERRLINIPSSPRLSQP